MNHACASRQQVTGLFHMKRMKRCNQCWVEKPVRSFSEAVSAGAAAKVFAERGARGLVIVEDEDGERSVWRVERLELFYARPVP